MIRLKLQMFAKSASQMAAYRKSKAMSKYANSGSESRSSGGGSSQAPSSTPTTRKAQDVTVGRINKASEISSRETYTLYRVGGANNEKEVEYKDKTGSELRDDIAHEKLEYNRKEKVWVSKKGYKYAIRKKKK